MGRKQAANLKMFNKSVIALTFGAGLALISTTQNCFASAGSQFFPNKYQQCLNASGGRGSIESVQYACDKAANPKWTTNGQNGCSLWIGSAQGAGVPTIYASSSSQIVNVAYWGMCTDRVDVTSDIWVNNDNDSIADGTSYNFARGLWGSPRSRGTTLDVGRFISGASSRNTDCGTAYTRTVKVGRKHSDNDSVHEMEQDITVIINNNPSCTQTEKGCKDFTPYSYTVSNSTAGTTSTVVKVKNPRLGNTASQYRGWQDKTYAMPTDKGIWLNCYFPGVQRQYGQDIYRTFSHGSHGTYSNNTYNTNYRPWSDAVGWTWYNEYWFDPDSTNMLHPAGKSFRLGDDTIREIRNTHQTVNTDTLQTFSQTMYGGVPSYHATTNEGKHSWSCFPYWTTCCGYDSCWSCIKYKTCHHSNNYWSVERNDDWASDTAKMLVPYNYKNRLDLSFPADQHNVYSGESFSFEGINLYVNPMNNRYTQAYYATTTPNLHLKLFAYVTSNPNSFAGGGTTETNGCKAIGKDSGKQCVKLRDEWIGKKNVEGILTGYQETGIWKGEYNALDASAGDYLCLVASVFPARRAEDPGDMTSTGNGNTRYSDPTCLPIAKKPTYQVWGSDMYSVNSLDAFVGKKANILNDYNPTYKWRDFAGEFKTVGGNPIYFGSWVEQGLILKDGTTKKISSGAGTATNPKNPAMAGVKGDFCEKRTALSFANYLNSSDSSICPKQEVVGASKISSDISDREEILKYWMGDESWPVNVAGGATINLNRPENIGAEATSATGAKIRYINAAGKLTINASTIPKGTTYLIKSPKKVTIAGNIKYSQNGYTSIQDIPKLVIYAKNIDIECGVKEVDAVLITDPDEDGNGGKVNTCSNAQTFGEGSSVADQFAAWNDPKRSKQLKIFGAVITDEMYMERTYGAATWNKVYKVEGNYPYSEENYPNGTDGIPAEIFNYDSTLLMWSEFMSGSAETDTLNTTYTHELAPRY